MDQNGSVINIAHPRRHLLGRKLAAVALGFMQRLGHELTDRCGVTVTEKKGGYNMAGQQCSSHLLEPVKEKKG